ncbi:YafY family protein [Candidatus Thiothrix sp. Deng01]|uniref:YafY family protein n=1 Tax=Candidatus Thiothrix phosphatis TaxID=3112415 RepID=A0ABU6CWX0_9GAMM|nr:YafY family protein [Candidatus Thiothrix sp. Deng01]MEB4591330.1 YafY family protein [Candidatus Thiothrix sp. Deng01]
MRRADRLFQLVQVLRNKRFVTARELAERLEVSERTIYRDIQDLSLSGVPVEGEAGVGYHLRYSLDIPPLMFTAAEIEALLVGARMLKAWGGSELGSSAQSVLDKVHAVIPAELRRHLEDSRLFALRFGPREDIETTLDACRHAIAKQRYLRLHYQRANHEDSQREVKPLGLFFWGNVWTLTAWCELRNDFRTFRLDRIRQLETLEKTFEESPGQTLVDFVTLMRSQHEAFPEGSNPAG